MSDSGQNPTLLTGEEAPVAGQADAAGEQAGIASPDANRAHTLLSESASVRPTGPAPPLREPPAAGTVLGGRYMLQELLAAGGMGKVFRGRHVELRTPIAVKVMHPYIAENPDHVERFRREARAASRLNHPNVVKIFDFGEVADTFYIVMEFIEGINLAEWLGKHTFPPPFSVILPVLLQVLDALAQAHRLGIVHRDLKPENVLLTTDAHGVLTSKIVDFGLARFQEPAEKDQTLTQADAVAGTPGYMSPEQCRSLKVTASTDLYAFGCILTELLQLAPPFTGDSPMDVISKHMFAPVAPLTRPAQAEPVPPLLEVLRLELLAKLPTQRPADAQTVRQRLLQAFDPAVSAAAFPARKSSDALGKREERLPTWNREAATLDRMTVTQAIPVALQTLTPVSNLDESCDLGLAAQGFQLMPAPPLPSSEAPEVVVLDCGEVTQATLDVIRQLRCSWPNTKVIACCSRVNAEQLNQLIEAGADDVARHPVTADVLGRKLSRLVRRP